MRKLLSLTAAMLLLVLMVMPGWAQEPAAQSEELQIQEIWTVEDLMAIAEDPTGSYRLMTDLDMAGIPWKGTEFFGKLDGNGHGILNLELTEFADGTLTTLDGNQKQYETRTAGLFNRMENAEITNLKLLGVTGRLECDEPAYLAALAGYSIDSYVTDCEIQCSLELRAYNGIVGVAGVIGYGSGWVQNCDVDATLISVDTDADTRDEQFLGGVFGMGFVDVNDSRILIRGYISEHGYVHSGGIGGLSMQSPLGFSRMGQTNNNTIVGEIRFFEDNQDRRAYCNSVCGERLSWNFQSKGNLGDFRGVETRDFETELRPEMCKNPVYTVTEVPGTCDSFGYTESICDICGYSFREDYTPRSHTVKQWEVLEKATVTEMGRSRGNCAECGKELFRMDEKLPEPPPTTAPTEAVTEQTTPTEPMKAQKAEAKTDVSVYIARALVVLTVAIAVYLGIFLYYYPRYKQPKE